MTSDEALAQDDSNTPDGPLEKRVVAIVDTGRVLGDEDCIRSAWMLCEQLKQTFARRGLALAMPELVRAAGFVQEHDSSAVRLGAER